MRFPAYDYDDMVEAQRLMLERLGVARLRLLMGTSMGCMHIFVWARGPSRFRPRGDADGLPAGRDRRPQPDVAPRSRSRASAATRPGPDGNYTAQPLQGLRTAVCAAADRRHGAALSPARLSRPRDAAEAYIVERIDRDIATRDANDLIYQLEASRTYDPLPNLERIRAPMTWVNSADDFINPPDYGIAEAAARRMPSARYVLIPASAETRGHGTHTWARFWKAELVDLLRRTER